MSCLNLWGPYWQKKTKIKEKNFPNEVSTCSGCCCGILQLCDVCEGGLGGLNGTTIQEFLRNVEEKNRSPEKFKFHNF